jgi:hypothetical protein
MHAHSETLRVLHTIYRNTLDPSLTVSDAIPGITSKLYPHQETLIQGMHDYRARMTHGIQLDDHELKARIGIIADPSGTGKTLSVLGYLASDTNQYPTTELSPYSTPYFYSQKITYPQASANLVVVPSHLFSYWQDEIKKHTNLSYISIDTRGKIKNDLFEHMITSTFVLTTNKCMRFIQEYALRHNITWNNIIIDEPLFAQLKTSDPKLHFQFLWLVTHQWQPLLFRTPLKKSQLLFLQEPMHPDLEEMLLENITEDMHVYPSQYVKQYAEYNHSHRGHMIIRNATKHICEHMPPAALEHSIIQCKSTTTLQSLSSIYLSRNTSISSMNIPTLFQALMIPSVPTNEYIQQYPEKTSLIQTKITENECGICLDPCIYPTILTCCHHVYCGKCLLQNTIIHYKCPTCRITLDVTRLNCLTEFGVNGLQSKKEVAMKVIRSKQPCIIFTLLDKIFYDLSNDMKALDIQAELVTSFSSRKAIKNFKEGSTTVLFVSKVELVRGLSLPASYLLFYHEEPVFEQKQALINVVSVRQAQQEPVRILHLHSEVPI